MSIKLDESIEKRNLIFDVSLPRCLLEAWNWEILQQLNQLVYDDDRFHKK
jgi:hypothetical protein